MLSSVSIVNLMSLTLSGCFVNVAQFLLGLVKERTLQLIAPAQAEVLSNNDSHELHLLSMRRHRVRRYNPTPLPKMVGDGKLSPRLEHVSRHRT